MSDEQTTNGADGTDATGGGKLSVLLVHHTPSPGVEALRQAMLEALSQEGLEDVSVMSVPALRASAHDVLHADAVLLLTPANIGYMSGALKHFFDQIYYPCLEASPKLPYGAVIHGNNDTTGALRAIEKIAGAIGWERAQGAVEITGEVGHAERERAGELAAGVAAALLL
ncbi:flavodoxin family protein [Dietzia sp.]|uniref:flavodoxin family protein n=1 Tax=Dietzia sp. TaxID=1871616 RepID=UPI002FD9CE17